MVLVVGMLETYTDPNPEIIDDVSRDSEAYHLDIKYIHECAVAALDGKGERQAPSFYEQLDAVFKTNQSTSKTDCGCLKACCRLLPIVGRYMRRETALKRFLSDINAPVSLARLRRLERFMDIDLDGTVDEAEIMAALELTPEQVEALKSLRARLQEEGVIAAFSDRNSPQPGRCLTADEVSVSAASEVAIEVRTSPV